MRMPCALAVVAALLSPARTQDVLPYPFTLDDLDNGLRIVTVPTEHRELVALYLVVATGSRDELEPGKSGFAHFFEHMMFRGSKNYTPEQQNAVFKKAGADRNAYTNDDFTCYHCSFGKSDLEAILAVEADRFQNLEYGESAFRTEAKAILGEYNTSVANPVRKLIEVARDTAFTTHTYKHTTMGFLRDIEQMPEQLDYSREFFRRHYRPDNTTILLVGDVERAKVVELVRKYFGGWPRMATVDAEPPAEPPQAAPLTAHVPWPAPTQPWVMVGYKGPAFSTTAKDMAVMDLVAALAFSENSPLYKQLFVREQVIDALAPQFSDRIDPYLVSVLARVKKVEDLPRVTRELLDTFARLRDTLVDPERLRDTKANLKYQFVAGLRSPDEIANALAGYLARARTPQAVNQVYQLYDAVTPDDIRAVARQYFVDDNRTLTTLAHGPIPAIDTTPAKPAESPIKTVLQPSSSPLVTVRCAFRCGAADDPKGKEGLAAVTAQMLVRGATQKQSYEDIVAQLFPLAASIDVQVDKELTTFYGTVHRDNLPAYLSLFGQCLTTPGFKPDDLARIQANSASFLDDGLRRSDEEELGKEVLYAELYQGHPYQHHNAGRLSTLPKLTLDDVRAFYAAHFTPQRLTLGIAGGFPAELPPELTRALLAQLPPGTTTKPAAIPPPPRLERSRLTIVQKPMRSTGIHIGFPIPVNRSHPDWVALWLVRSWLGEHRSDNSHLYQRLRELRGLNYGDYAYIEYFPGGSRQFQPDPNLVRQSQAFQIWIRPVEPQNGPFALKAALYELRKLVRDGLTPQAFATTREFLRKQVHLLVQTQTARLGYGLDSEFYGTDDFVQQVHKTLEWLTVDEVNRALRAHLRGDRLQIVVVTADAANFRDQVLGLEPTLPTYGSVLPVEVLAEDKEIAALRVGVLASDVKIVPVEQVFQ